MDTLLSRLKNGDKAAFTEIYAEYSNRLFEFVFAKSGSTFYADEVVQITFMKLWERHHQINIEIALPAQIYQIAKTSLIDVLRKTEKDRLREAKLTPSKIHINSGRNRLEECDVLSALRKTVSIMPPIRRKVFSLRIDEQLSYKEIAAMLTISVKTVNKHMELAMKQIKPVLKFFLS